LLSPDHDWQSLFDYHDHSITLPTDICTTNSRPDIIIWSLSLRKVILIELTCPSEENIQTAKIRKTERYTPLLQQIQPAGWAVSLFLVEAGVRGCLSRSFHQCPRAIGVPNSTAKKTLKAVQTVVSRCSYIIFHSHKNLIWAKNHLFVLR
jgi:hypothetical protein